MARARLPPFAVSLLAILSPASLALAADVTCYVDSVAGDDTKSGLSEADAIQSRTKIPSSCTTVKFKRGSVFNLASGEYVLPSSSGMMMSKVKVLTNYGDPTLPLPKFIKERQPNNGGMIQGYQGGMTIDGLYLSGSQSDANMKNLAQGIGIMVGSNSKIINSEITNCDIGIMLSGTGSLVQNNYVHDLHVSVDAAPGVDPNVVGGAEGIFVNGSNNEVAYNSFVNCSNYAEWTGGSCDGGATEVTVGADGAELSGVKIHHNYSYNSCGFFEVSSMFSTDKENPVRGKFLDSEFYNNVTIDSGWLHLLQVANTDMHNIRWENNTLVQHKGSLNQGILMVVYTAVASGMSGGQLYEDSIYWTNNLFVADGVNFMNPDSRVVQSNNLIIKNAATQDPGFKNLKGTNATDFELVAGSPAINAGVLLPNRTLDFLNRTIPDPSGQADIGAFELGGTEVSPRPIPPSDGGGGTAVVPPTTGGSTSTPAGAGGSVISPKGTGGSANPPKGAGGSTPPPKGAGGSTTSPKGGSTAPASSGQGGGGGGASSAGGSGGSEPPAGSGGSGGANGTPGGEGTGHKGCSCRVAGVADGPGTWFAMLGLALLVVRRRRWQSLTQTGA